MPKTHRSTKRENTSFTHRSFLAPTVTCCSKTPADDKLAQEVTADKRRIMRFTRITCYQLREEDQKKSEEKGEEEEEEERETERERGEGRGGEGRRQK